MRLMELPCEVFPCPVLSVPAMRLVPAVLLMGDVFPEPHAVPTLDTSPPPGLLKSFVTPCDGRTSSGLDRGGQTLSLMDTLLSCALQRSMFSQRMQEAATKETTHINQTGSPTHSFRLGYVAQGDSLTVYVAIVKGGGPPTAFEGVSRSDRRSTSKSAYQGMQPPKDSHSLASRRKIRLMTSLICKAPS